ncbi:MAG: UvrD-helicase domain-containing protein [Rickettsiaceae bacterium]|nr:UvrD-helicase domain-containing protein [Rickettsiaceae bacterium]
MSLQQINASDPSSSIWVSASAGTGKTKILTDRVLRLLLTGAKLNKILCLTFTNAAANEMKERIINTIFRWSILPKSELNLELKNTQGTVPSQEQLNLASDLYEQYLRSENSLNVQTIHSFCQKLLKQFPIEAGISPHFQIIDEIQEQALLNEVKTIILRHHDLEIISKYLITNFHELIIDEIFNEIIQNKHLFVKNYLETNILSVSQHLINELSKAPETYFTEFTDHPILQDVFESQATFNKIKNLFLTEQGTIRKYLRVNLKKDSIGYKKLLDLQKDFYQKTQIIKDQQIQYFSSIIELLSNVLISQYENIKLQKALLDYDDLIDKTCKLLNNSNAKEWILYKLDGFIDHLLVDEAQDTSANQWKIINSLITEFYSGEGAEKENRTIFVVGDAKQSIFSFQGAQLEIFVKTNIQLAEKIYYANKKFSNINLEISYRSGQEILDIVYNTFYDQQRYAPFSFSMPISYLEAFKKNIKSSVELWPLCRTENPEKEFWPIKKNIIATTSPQTILAHKIASNIKNIINSKVILSSTQKPVRLQDIMILFRKRDELVKQVIKALEENNLNVSGLDRINLKENMAVQDLLTIARFVINPDDDLNLASLLQSQIIGFTTKELEQLASKRSTSIWQYLSLNDNQYEDIYRKLSEFNTLYTKTNILEFFQYITDVMGYRKLLGFKNKNASEDAINELLYICENYMIQNGNSLQKFLLWLESINSSIKSENLGEDQVQIMTVHGAKGLQAPIVIICDTTSIPTNNNRFFWTENQDLVITRHADDNSEYIQDLKKEAKKRSYAEYLRLLYVAMTRAEEKLIICGYQTNQAVHDDCWYKVISKTMQRLGSALEDGTLIYGTNELSYITENNVDPKTQNILYFYPQNISTKLITKSDKSNNIIHTNSPLTSGNPLEYGLVFHKILEDSISSNMLHKMPQHPFIKSLTLSEQSRILCSIEKILANTEFKELLKLKTITEINIGTITDTDSIELKRIDLMICDGERVIIIDYKSDLHPASDVYTVPVIYVQQLANYKNICELVYPSKKIITKILWLENGQLMDIHN